jgi:hypothetical protein
MLDLPGQGDLGRSNEPLVGFALALRASLSAMQGQIPGTHGSATAKWLSVAD